MLGFLFRKKPTPKPINLPFMLRDGYKAIVTPLEGSDNSKWKVKVVVLDEAGRDIGSTLLRHKDGLFKSPYSVMWKPLKDTVRQYGAIAINCDSDGGSLESIDEAYLMSKLQAPAAVSAGEDD